ncbi:MAG TPA: O-antigen ligase family protein [Novosphingobium sp.]|nr:O-antigen ligase family protein [Novosphingobium sp.]
MAATNRRNARYSDSRAGFERLPVEPLAAALVFCLCIQSLGSRVVLAELALLGALLTIRWREGWRLLYASFPFLLLPLLAVASAGWSDVPGISFRYGLQLLITVVMGTAIASTVPLPRIPLVVFIGTGLAMLIGIASGRTGGSLEGEVLIGFTGSKNQIGYISLFWLSSSLCVAASSRSGWPLRIAALICVVPAIYMIWQAHATTALVSAIAAIGILGVLAAVSLLPSGGRLFCLCAMALMLLPAAAALPQIEAYADHIRSDVLQKDAGLTGRTLLWQSADELIARRPVTGYGYKAIWMGQEGVGLLARNGHTDGRSFHFHDTVRELRVDLGIPGLVLFLLPLGYVLIRAVPLLVAQVTPARAFLAVTLLLICLRLRTELEIGPFLADTVLLYVALAAISRTPIGQAPPHRARSPMPIRSRRERKPA